MILGALGDILIMVGMAMTPIGIPLVLAGLALKFGGALVGAAGGKRGMAGDSSTGAVSSNIPSMDQSMTNEFTIRGTDLVTVNKSSTGLLNRLG
jgi:hypothetical protein